MRSRKSPTVTISPSGDPIASAPTVGVVAEMEPDSTIEESSPAADSQSPPAVVAVPEPTIAERVNQRREERRADDRRWYAKLVAAGKTSDDRVVDELADLARILGLQTEDLQRDSKMVTEIRGLLPVAESLESREASRLKAIESWHATRVANRNEIKRLERAIIDSEVAYRTAATAKDDASRAVNRLNYLRQNHPEMVAAVEESNGSTESANA
jgi:hypothetical protein